jgi:EamA domain-containing membrane protein RarD
MGSLVYGEPVSVLRLASFAVIWLGLGVMVRDRWRSGR